jgi:hypothetical protein
MSKLIGRVAVIEPEPEFICFMCGAITETRPYGPGFQEVCHPCAMKDPEGTKKRMKHKLFGDPIDPKDIGEL